MLPSNYAPDYAPFTLDSDGHLLKIPVLIKVATVLKALVLTTKFLNYTHEVSYCYYTGGPESDFRDRRGWTGAR